MRRLLIVFLFLPVLSGCDRSFDLFPLEVGAGDELRRVPLRERPGRDTEEEGLLSDAGQPLTLLPAEPIGIDRPTHLLVRLSAPAADLAVTVRDGDGQPIARGTPFEAFAEARSGGVAAAMRVPGTSALGSIELALGADRQVAVGVVGVALGSAPTGAGFLGNERSFYASPGVVPERWGADAVEEPDGSPRRWAVDRRDAEGWSADEPVEIRYRYTPAEDPSAAGVALLTAGDASFELELRPGEKRVVLHPRIERIVVEAVSLEFAGAGLEVEWVGPLRDPVDALPSAIPVDIGTLSRYEPEFWRQSDFELFSWTLYPEVLIVDSATYEIQARFFRRLAFFVEKLGFRGTLLSDDELRGRHGYNAHNYNAQGLAAFYTEADATGIALTAEEELLREILVSHRIVEAVDGGYAPGRGGILAVSQESRMIPTLRELLLSHEAYHGVYYAEPAYVRAVDEVWEALDADQQRYWRLLLSGLRYDVDDEYLLRNEYHAYLMQQPVAQATWYFESRSADRIARWFPGSADWLQSYLNRYRGTHREQAVSVEEALRMITGLSARDVSCLEPIAIR